MLQGRVYPRVRGVLGVLKYKSFIQIRRNMLVQRMKSNANYAGQKVKFLTVLFDKHYFWMEDIDGTTYLLRAVEDKNSDFGWAPTFV
jgi:hypothetical protein